MTPQLVTSTPLNVTLINASMPLWMLLVGAIGWQQRPTRWQLAGALLAVRLAEEAPHVVLGRGKHRRIVAS